jgi:hypothetical protein
MMTVMRPVSTASRLKTLTITAENGKPTWQKRRHCTAQNFSSEKSPNAVKLGVGV